jgi:hypothetical protein
VPGISITTASSGSLPTKHLWLSLTGNQKYAVVYTNKKYKPAFKEDFADAHLVKYPYRRKQARF